MRNFLTARELRASVRKLILALGATAALAGGTTFVLAQASAQQEPPTFSVYPMPGTLTAGAKTTISFRGGDAAALGTVTVTRLAQRQPHRQAARALRRPGRELRAGQAVRGQARRSTVDDRPQRRRRHRRRLQVQRSATRPRARRARSSSRTSAAARSRSTTTRPDLTPPSVTVTTALPGRAPGLVFLAPKAGRGQDGPMIINDKGQTRLVQVHARARSRPTSASRATSASPS